MVQNLHILARAGIVHGDLSTYNILVQHGRPWIIDVPQAVDLFLHSAGRELFERDITNICAQFGRLGVDCDPERLTDELLTGAR